MTPKSFLFCVLLMAASFAGKAQLLINEVSQGTSGNKEYIELVVTGTHTCSDTSADIRGWIFDDNGGWYGTSAISTGCYRFANVANWSAVPYGSIILIYNDGDKNTNITQADDPTDNNHDGVYILPITSTYIESNTASPNSSLGSSFSYPSSGFSASGSWTPMALNNNGDAVVVVDPTALSVAHHAITYGNLSGGVHISSSGSQKVYYANGSNYNSATGWTAGSAPSDETPGAANNPANLTWINTFKQVVSGGTINVTAYDTICAGSTYTFNNTQYATAGTYTGHFVSVHGCDSVVTLHLAVRPLPAPPSVVSPITYCQDAISATLQANGQNILWYTTPAGTGSTTAPTPITATPGTQIFYVSQTVNGCESNKDSITVVVKAKPVPPTVNTPVLYCKHEVAVALTAVGQNLMWYTDPNGVSGSMVAPVPSTDKAGSTDWYVTQEQNGCESNKAMLTVTVNEVVAIFTVSKDTFCSGDTIQFTSNSTGGNLTYFWDFGNGFSSTTDNPALTVNDAGTFTVKLVCTNDHGCKDSTTKRITVLPLPQFSFSVLDSVLCQGTPATFTSNFSPGYLYADWDFGDGSTISMVQNPQHAYENNGHYTVTVAARYAYCPEKTQQHEIIVHPHPMVNIGPDTSMCPGSTAIPLFDRFYDAANTYTWSTGETTPGILATHTGTYWLQASNGTCTTTDSMEVFKSCYIDVPNAFTPNGDGDNDYFFPRQLLSREMIAFHMQIFNRWGQLIFETTKTDGRGWDGKMNDVAQPTGVYIYMIQAKFMNNTEEKYQGNLTLLR